MQPHTTKNNDVISSAIFSVNVECYSVLRSPTIKLPNHPSTYTLCN